MSRCRTSAVNLEIFQNLRIRLDSITSKSVIPLPFVDLDELFGRLFISLDCACGFDA